VPTFEEFADRLAHASDPLERVAAAEALAALGDRRVAATLAKALADPDPAVRERVEDLLGEFCRGDDTGHLQALLAEAERVAEALAAEVQRLRGGAPAEAAPAPVQPIEPPPGFQGACALVRLTGEPIHVKAVSRVVAAALSKPAFEVSRELHSTKGFLARGVPAPAAASLVRKLAESRLAAGAVPMEWLPAPAELVRVREPMFAAGSLTGRVAPSSQVAVSWDTVELAVAARVASDLEPEAIEEDWSPFTPPLKPRGKPGAREQPAYEYLIELLAGSPVRRLRLLTHDLDFRTMHRRLSSFGKVARVARDLRRHLDSRRLSAGVRRLADRDEEDWEDLTFISHLSYDAYVTWLRLLLRLGVPLPR